jgi:zinc transport system substrate-binding protein
LKKEDNILSKFVRKIKLIIMVAMLGLAMLAIFGCTGSEKKTSLLPGNSEKIYVAVSIVPEASFVKAVGGDRVEVLTMIPPGADPENYAPGPKLMEQLSDAQIYFASVSLQKPMVFYQGSSSSIRK